MIKDVEEIPKVVNEESFNTIGKTFEKTQDFLSSIQSFALKMKPALWASLSLTKDYLF